MNPRTTSPQPVPILEGVVTTTNDDQSINVSPMGPYVYDNFSRIVLRPFPTSTTGKNLLHTRQGVFQITDDVELIARAALNCLESPAFIPIQDWPVPALESACRWYAFDVVEIDDTQQRFVFEANVRHSGRRREFIGFNRAKHAVLEATILATRLHLLSAEDVERQVGQLHPLVEKTGGPQEHAAWELVTEYIRSHFQPTV